MDRIDQFTTLTLAGDDKIAARVDYQACGRCGFRLMRVETTIMGNQHLVVTRCPICEQFDTDIPGQPGESIPADKKLQYFDVWLSTHGLNRETLESHYHLNADHFFDDEC